MLYLVHNAGLVAVLAPFVPVVVEMLAASVPVGHLDDRR